MKKVMRNSNAVKVTFLCDRKLYGRFQSVAKKRGHDGTWYFMSAISRLVKEDKMIGKRVELSYAGRALTGVLTLLTEDLIGITEDEHPLRNEFYPRSLVNSLELSKNQEPNPISEAFAKGLIRRLGDS